MWRGKGYSMYKRMYSTHSWLWADNQFPAHLQFCFVFDFFTKTEQVSEVLPYVRTYPMKIKSRYVPLPKKGPWATSGTFVVSIIYTPLNVMTYVKDRCTLTIYYLCLENRNMASITMACLWQNASPQKPLVPLSWLPGLQGWKHSPFHLSETKLQNPMNKHRRGTISSGKLQEDFGKGEKLATKTQVLSHKVAGWNLILESRRVVLKSLYSEKRALKVLNGWPW